MACNKAFCPLKTKEHRLRTYIEKRLDTKYNSKFFLTIVINTYLKKGECPELFFFFQ